jgi:hypothetical protein
LFLPKFYKILPYSNNEVMILDKQKKKLPKPLKTDKFQAKYDKPGNEFYLIKAMKPLFDPSKNRTHFVEVQIQLVVKPSGGLAGREV